MKYDPFPNLIIYHKSQKTSVTSNSNAGELPNHELSKQFWSCSWDWWCNYHVCHFKINCLHHTKPISTNLWKSPLAWHIVYIYRLQVAMQSPKQFLKHFQRVLHVWTYTMTCFFKARSCLILPDFPTTSPLSLSRNCCFSRLDVKKQLISSWHCSSER